MQNVSLPQWLAREEKYEPGSDKDAFIDKSILSVLGVLSKVRTQGSVRGRKNRAHAEYKLVLTILLVVLMSLSQSLAYVAIITVSVLCILSLLPAGEIAAVIRSSLVATLFTAVILLPAGILGNWHSVWMITPKVFATVSMIAILSAGTSWHALTGALKVLFIPDIFIFVFDIAVKYIFLLGEFALNMLYALKLRSVGRNTGKRMSLSGIAGTMFLRSREMAGEMHAAMECRGFSGEYRRPAKFRFNLADAAVVVTAAMAVLLFVYVR